MRLSSKRRVIPMAHRKLLYVFGKKIDLSLNSICHSFIGYIVFKTLLRFSPLPIHARLVIAPQNPSCKILTYCTNAASPLASMISIAVSHCFLTPFGHRISSFRSHTSAPTYRRCFEEMIIGFEIYGTPFVQYVEL